VPEAVVTALIESHCEKLRSVSEISRLNAENCSDGIE